MKNILSLGFTLFLAVTVFAAGGTETLVLKTSAVCGGCKTRIEAAVNELPGIKTATVDLTNGSLTVAYKDKKVSADDIKNAVLDMLEIQPENVLVRNVMPEKLKNIYFSQFTFGETCKKAKLRTLIFTIFFTYFQFI